MKTIFTFFTELVTFTPLFLQYPEWIVYNSSNSGLPSDNVYTLAIDGSGNKWMGTFGLGTADGLTKFDGTNWTVYNTSNSGLPDNSVFSPTIDVSSNKWIRTGHGLAVYNEGGVITSIKDNTQVLAQIKSILYQNYPSPFNPTTTIKYSIPKTSNVKLKVFDLLGREVTELVNEEKSPGDYTINFNASGLASGIYYYQLRSDKSHQAKKMIIR